MTKILAFFLQNETDYSEKMGEMVGGIVFVLVIIMLIGWMISKYTKKA